MGSAAAALAAKGAASCASSWLEKAESVEYHESAVQFIERPEKDWIEVSQRNLADSLADWTTMEYESALGTLRSAYRFPIGVMTALKGHFVAEATSGLAGDNSSMRMLPTYVNQRVTGKEAGHFFALDLGGTNFRVLRLTLEGGGVVGPIKQAKFKVPDAIKRGTGDDLFGFLADSVAIFLAKECDGNPNGNLGFTFSFPTKQTALNAGNLIAWNKEFAASGVIGEDVVSLLQSQFEARGINLKVKALANDTVGTMEASAYIHPGTVMGVILGTGTNAAYIEKTANVPKLGSAPTEETVINTEWGNLDMRKFMNKYDQSVDAATDNPGFQTFEKMISGMYLGELCRLSIIDPQINSGFSSGCSAALGTAFGAKQSFPTALMSTIEADSTPELSQAASALAQHGVTQTTFRDRVLLREACVCVSTRAARLSSVAIAGLLEMIPATQEGCTIAVDGTVFECYPFFKERMEAGLEDLLGKDRAHAVELVLAKDGSGVGAAIIAAIADA